MALLRRLDDRVRSEMVLLAPGNCFIPASLTNVISAETDTRTG